MESGIFLTEPYDPNRIPVLLVHGLISTPIIWRDIVPEMLSDPQIARRFQFIFFTYPSSYPIEQSAQLLREELAALREKYDPNGNDPRTTNMVAIGHSMGGVLVRTLVAEIGDNLWKQFNDEPFDQANVSSRQEEIRGLVFFEPDPAVRRAIFIATPHRGAELAEKGSLNLISRVAKLPGGVMRSTMNLHDPRVSQDLNPTIEIGKKTTSVQFLQPGSPIMEALDVSPYRTGLVYHSIIGDRGNGDTPNSSDGLVEYWSSHQDGAVSELIVPLGHKA
ncbi:MAG: pimeloyl-ACP methyl ester carboxylesterase [Verrucomicrobiales bacterium]|jgi:pimeloyl-ACP methyl ester carboxylesterase